MRASACAAIAALAVVVVLPARSVGITVPPRVRIEPIASFDSLILTEPGAWSPRGARILLHGSDGRGPSRIHVFDAAHAELGLRRVADFGAWIRGSGWSPDGAWVFALVGDAHPRNWRALLALPAGGGKADTVATGALWPAGWGSDGRFYVRADRAWRAIAPPGGWKRIAASAGAAPLRAEVGRGFTLRFLPYAPGGPGEPLLLGLYGRSQSELKLFDMLPDASLSLVAVSQDTSGAWRLVDKTGATRADLRQGGIRFMPSAISGDGELVAGFQGTGGGEAGWTTTWLEVGDTGGRWTTRIAGGEGGASPQLSREGLFIAWMDGGGTRIGRLVIEWR